MTIADRTTASVQTIIALHCSGANGSQWRALEDMLDAGSRLIAPDHYGCESVGPWPGERAFSIDDEAARTLAIVDATERKVHLVGHSYGGGVALHIALLRPHRIASLSLYEPSAFHLLPQCGREGSAAYGEIARLARETTDRIAEGDCRGAVARFVDYWNGPDAWGAMAPRVQAALTRWAPKIPLDFRALMRTAARLDDYSALTFPVLLLRGEHAPDPTRIISDTLAGVFPRGRLRVIPGCGHMGPLTHADRVLPLIAARIAAAAAAMPGLRRSVEAARRHDGPLADKSHRLHDHPCAPSPFGAPI